MQWALDFVVFTYFFPAIGLTIFGLFVFSAWMADLSDMQPQIGAVTKAAHGMGMIVCGGYILSVWHPTEGYRLYIYCVYGWFICLGIFWLFIGTARAQVYQDAHLMTRGLVKAAFGCIVWLFWRYWRLQVWWLWRWHTEIDPLVMTVCLWCWTTGIMKFLVCSRRRPQLQFPGPPDIYGPPGETRR